MAAFLFKSYTEAAHTCPILILPLVSHVRVSCCNTRNLPQQQLGCSPKRCSWTWRFLYFSLCLAPIPSHLESHIQHWLPELNGGSVLSCRGTGARGTCRVQIQKVRLWIKAAKKFPSLSKHLTAEKSRALTYTSVSCRRLRLRDGNQVKDSRTCIYTA